MNLWWPLTRASGLVSWYSMGFSSIVGIVLSTRLFPDRRRPAWLLDAHRWTAGISLVALFTHLVALIADSYVHFGVREILVPYASTWRPGAVALGVIALWITVVITGAAALRRKLPRPLWRWIHRGAYVSFLLTSLHAAMAGTDAARRAYGVGAALLITAVSAALVYRVACTEPPKRTRPGRVRVAGVTADERASRLDPSGPSRPAESTASAATPPSAASRPVVVRR